VLHKYDSETDPEPPDTVDEENTELASLRPAETIRLEIRYKFRWLSDDADYRWTPTSQEAATTIDDSKLGEAGENMPAGPPEGPGEDGKETAVLTGGGDWNASLTNLSWVAARKCVGESAISVPSRPSSPLTSMQRVSTRKRGYRIREDDLRLAETAQTPMTPSKPVKKSLGFVRLGCGRGSTHTTEEKPAIAGKYGGLGFRLG
jgi:hypothetical protein